MIPSWISISNLKEAHFVPNTELEFKLLEVLSSSWVKWVLLVLAILAYAHTPNIFYTQVCNYQFAIRINALPSSYSPCDQFVKRMRVRKVSLAYAPRTLVILYLRNAGE
jgi:hypothetical protein